MGSLSLIGACTAGCWLLSGADVCAPRHDGPGGRVCIGRCVVKETPVRQPTRGVGGRERTQKKGQQGGFRRPHRPPDVGHLGVV